MKILAFVALILVLATMISCKSPQPALPTAEERRAEIEIEVLKTLEKAGFTPDVLNVLKVVKPDGEYDGTFVLFDARADNPVADLVKYVRPLSVKLAAMVDGQEEVLLEGEGMVFLLEGWALTSPQLALAGPVVPEGVALGNLLMSSEVMEGLKNKEYWFSMRVRSDTGQDDYWKFERIEKLPLFLGSMVVFERSKPLMFPSASKFPYPLAELEKVNSGGKQDVVIGVGALFLDDETMVLHTYQGAAEFVSPEQGVVIINAFLPQSYVGGPVFVLMDGEPQLLGLLQFTSGAKAKVLFMETILDEIQQEAKIDIQATFGK